MNSNTPPVIVNEITKISHQATVDSTKVALLYTALFTLLGFLVSFSLPSHKDLEQNQSVAAHKKQPPKRPSI